MDEGKLNNFAQLNGVVVGAPTLSHSAYNEDFYQFELQVKRLSDNTDTLPVLIGSRLMPPEDIQIGKHIAVAGEFRSHNKVVDDKSRLILQLFAKKILPDDERDILTLEQANIIKLCGYICRPPVFRETPFGRQICDLLLAVNRNYYYKSDYIPCLTWGRNAHFACSLPVGTFVSIEGRIQSRPYKKATEEGIVDRTAYEVSCKKFTVLENPGLGQDVKAPDIEAE